jgi:hypothetical protein
MASKLVLAHQLHERAVDAENHEHVGEAGLALGQHEFGSLEHPLAEALSYQRPVRR